MDKRKFQLFVETKVGGKTCNRDSNCNVSMLIVNEVEYFNNKQMM